MPLDQFLTDQAALDMPRVESVKIEQRRAKRRRRGGCPSLDFRHWLVGRRRRPGLEFRLGSVRRRGQHRPLLRQVPPSAQLTGAVTPSALRV